MTLLQKTMRDAAIELDEYNSRIKLIRYQTDDLKSLTRHLEELAEEKDLGKVMIYADPGDTATFRKLGFEKEGEISIFFNGEPTYILSRFLDDWRSVVKDEAKKDQIIKMAEQTETLDQPPPIDSAFHIRHATPDDAGELAQLYRLVFETYPTPIHEEAFIKECMQNHVYFTVITHKEKIISSASADVFTKYNCAEITDCATHPAYRGKGLLSAIIFDLEQRMKEGGVPNLFSLTRAISTGMNIVMAKLGFEYQGRLIQNSHIAGQFEDMNIWVKKLKI